jgi:hypothetical protein
MNSEIEPDDAINKIIALSNQIDAIKQIDYPQGERTKHLLETRIKNFVRATFQDDEKKLEDLAQDRTSHQKPLSGSRDDELITQINYETDLEILQNHLIGFKDELELFKSSREKRKQSSSQEQSVSSTSPRIQLGPNSTYVAAGNITGSNIGHDNKIDNSQYKNANIYPTLKRDSGLLDIIAPILMNRFGKEKLKKGAIISIILGILPFISGVLIPSISKFSIDLGLFIGICAIGGLLIVLGIILIKVTVYYDFMSCKACKGEFTYDETGTPQTEETKTRWGFNEVTYRHYKCRDCGNIKKTRTINEFNNNGERIASSGEIEVP